MGSTAGSSHQANTQIGFRVARLTLACGYRVAQKKFRERQKAKQANNNRRLQELEERLERLIQEKQDLHSTNQLLSHILEVNNTHFGELQSQQAPPPSRTLYSSPINPPLPISILPCHPLLCFQTQ